MTLPWQFGPLKPASPILKSASGMGEFSLREKILSEVTYWARISCLAGADLWAARV